MNDPLQEFTNTILAIKQFQEKSREIFDDYEALLKSKNTYENILKDWVKENKKDINNGIVDVKYIQGYKKWYEFSLFSKKTQKLIKENGALIEQEPIVDKEKVDELAKQEIISREEIRNAYKEESISPSVRIKIL